PAWARLLPELLRARNYRSYHSGKWHIDGPRLKAGFDRSYSIEDHDRLFVPKQHLVDDQPLPAATADDRYYVTTAIADYAIDHLRQHAKDQPNQPFFSYVAFTAPHFPLKAPAAEIARFLHQYDQGWDEVRQQRYARQREAGLIRTPLAALEREVGPPYPFPNALQKLGPGEVNLTLPWKELTAEQQQFQATKMAIHAAMIACMDREIGRIIEQIKAMNAWENTLVLFLSDNGASAEIMVRGDGHDSAAAPGSEASFLCLGPGWSSAANTPFRRHKTWVHEGGIATPLIAHWPRGIKTTGELRHVPGHVIDVVPTVLELAGIEPAANLPGKSLVPTLAEDRPIARDYLWWLHEGNRALRKGDWKLVALKNSDAWELYDLATDRAEQRNLAAQMPDKVAELQALWNSARDRFTQDATRDGLVKPSQPSSKKKKAD
ncbi:MAG: sulfatase-like hydrolase/transferase, partial [Planctomycetota bacterium]